MATTAPTERTEPRYDLAGRTALVTGAASGIGHATAALLVRCGAAVAVNHLPGDARGPEAVARLNDAGPGRAVAVPGAVGDGREDGLARAALDALGGRLDLLVNNAGTPAVRALVPPERMEEMTDAVWDEVLSVNLVGLFRLTRACTPALAASGRGAVVSIASVAGLTSRGSSLAYGASKAGVVSLTRFLGRGLGPQGVRVNAVAPGAVDSSWQVEWTDEQRRQSVEGAPLGRRCVPEDIAEAIVFLGVGAAMVTGQILVVDGGLTL